MLTRKGATNVHNSLIFWVFNPSNIQGKERKQRQPAHVSPTTSLQLSKLEGQSWQKLMVFPLIYFFKCLSMQAIVSKSSTCQERNCPLYLVVTFTVEGHFDGYFLSLREDYTANSGCEWRAGRGHSPLIRRLFLDFSCQTQNVVQQRNTSSNYFKWTQSPNTENLLSARHCARYCKE